MKIRPIAIYLPQFHPIPENDEWWGKGFTEWTNVVRAKPLFKGHYQPHMPADLGFYDLRITEVMQEQIQMAKDAGIYGFMFYHYWFEGKRLLESPLENYLADKSLDFPFFLCWANENWTKRWDGKELDVLLKQNYSEIDFAAHFKILKRFFNDERYIKVNDKPVIAIYKVSLIPNLKKLLAIWKLMALEAGFKGLYIIKVEANKNERKIKLDETGLDASIEFQPDWQFIKHYLFSPNFEYALKYFLTRNKLLPKRIKSYFKKKYMNINTIVDYTKYAKQFYNFENGNYTKYPVIIPSWDNTSRRTKGSAVIFHNSSPEGYGRWLKRLLDSFKPYSEEENFIFINAWNEWAEGNHLEPCAKWGKKYLEVTKEVLKAKK